MNFFRKLSFRGQLTAAILSGTVLVTLITGAWSYRLAVRQFREMSTQLTQNTVNTLRESVQSYLTSAIGHTTDILSGTALRQIAETENPGDLAGLSCWQAMQYDIQKQVSLANSDTVSFSSVEIHFENGLSFSTRESPFYKNYSECDSALSRKYGTRNGYIGIHWLALPAENGKYMEPCCFRYIYNQRMKPIGVALFSLNSARIRKLLSAADSSFLMDTDGIVLASGNRSLIGTSYENASLLDEIRRKPENNTVTYKTTQSEQLISYAPVGTVNCYLIVPNNEYEALYQSKTAAYRHSVLTMLLASILFSTVISMAISRGMSADFQELSGFIKKVDINKNTGLRCAVSGNNEYARIGAGINAMLDSIAESEKEKEEGLRLNQALELRLLQAQLNPHLLYNTLNSVIWNLENEKNDNAIQLIASLSGYFQYALSDGKQCIPLRDELKLIRYYLDLQRLARHKSFTFSAEIPEFIQDSLIPKLMLQPLVENCIRHGFDGYRSDGVMLLTGTEENGTIRLVLRDNGVGILPDELDQLRDMLSAQIPLTEPRSFGLYGISRTIRQLYGSEYGLTVESEIDSFTEVTITIPYRSSL